MGRVLPGTDNVIDARLAALFLPDIFRRRIDLILEKGTKRLAFEFKASMSPRVSRGFPDTLALLKPDRTWVVSPVEESYALASGATVANLNEVLEELA